MSAPLFVILLVCFASIALADDFKTIDGKEYKNVKVSRVEPDGLVLMTKSGISKVYFTELPKEVQQRFNYDAEKSAAYSAEQNAALDQARKQQEQRKKAEDTAKNNNYFAEQQSATVSAKNQTESPNPSVEQLQSNFQAMAETVRQQLSAAFDDEKVEAYLLGELRRVS